MKPPHLPDKAGYAIVTDAQAHATQCGTLQDAVDDEGASFRVEDGFVLVLGQKPGSTWLLLSCPFCPTTLASIVPTPFDDWAAKYDPQPRPGCTAQGLDSLVHDPLRPSDMARVDAAYASDPRCVWTLVDEEGKIALTSGFQRVNRLGHLLTRNPAQHEVHLVLDETAENDTI